MKQQDKPIKIRVNNSNESTRVQNALFTLGYEWFKSIFNPYTTSIRLDPSYPQKWLFIDPEYDNVINSTWLDLELPNHTEMTLLELEKLAQEKNNSNIY